LQVNKCDKIMVPGSFHYLGHGFIIIILAKIGLEYDSSRGNTVSRKEKDRHQSDGPNPLSLRFSRRRDGRSVRSNEARRIRKWSLESNRNASGMPLTDHPY